MTPAPTAGPHRIGVIGAAGRMGTLACAAIDAAHGLELAARIDVGDDLAALTSAGCDTVLHFSHPDVVQDHIRWAIDAGLHSVVGTSGIGPERQAEINAWLQPHPELSVLVVPNFAIGAVLALSFARQAARFFESAEVLELHHAGKADAPSGTAVAAAHQIADARSAAGLGPIPDATTVDPDHARGADVAGVHVHAVRLPGLVAHLEVLFGSQGETLTIRHDSLSRESFMPGVIAALRGVRTRPGLTVGLESLLLG